MSSPNSGTYVAIVSDEGCVIQDDIIITFNELDDNFFEMTPTCNGGTVDSATLATPGGTFSFADPQPTDGAVIDSTTGEVTGGVFTTQYIVSYTTPDCVAIGQFILIPLDGDDSSFEMTPTCDGGEVTSVETTPGGTYLLLRIHSTNGWGSNRSNNRRQLQVEYLRHNLHQLVTLLPETVCDNYGQFLVTPLDGDDSSFEMTPTCDGAVVDTTTLATPGGTFAFADPQPTDGAVIEDSTTGDSHRR